MKKILEANFLFANILVPLIALGLYCVSFAYISSLYFIEGVNFYFASKLGKYALLLAVGVSLIFFVMLKLGKISRLEFKHFSEKLFPVDTLLLLLPLMPITQYVLNNQDVLSPTDSLYVLIIFTLFSSLYVFVIPALLAVVIPTRPLMALGLAFVFTITNMASMSNTFNWFEAGRLKIQLTALGGAFLIAWIFYGLGQRKTLNLIIAAVFIFNSSVQFLSQKAETGAPSTSFEQSQLLTLVENKTPVVTPNIYLLVYDAYIPNETMLAYGIDNSAQENFLSGQGFKLYPHTYSIGSASIETMSKVINASTEYYGDRRNAVSGNGITQKILRDHGYETYGIFPTDFFIRGIGSSYDYSSPQKITPPYILLSKAIFMGEFRFDAEDVGYGQQTHNEFVEIKGKVFENISEKQMFIYTHSDLPAHSQNSGACLANETAQFKKRLTNANIEMRQDIDLIVKNDPGAIVIVASDHGPYLTKNCYVTTDVYDISEISRLDIQDRYATFLAIRWPTGDLVHYDDIIVLQDIFPAVFAYLYQDKTILELKVEPIISTPNSISGVSVDNGIIVGGINDGEPLFLTDD